MSSRRTATAALAAGLVFACVGGARAQQDHATPQEVVQRVRQAAQDIAKQGEAGLATYGSKNDTSVWKDSYVFVVSCEGGSAVTPPTRSGRSSRASRSRRPSPTARGRASRSAPITAPRDGSRTAGGWSTTSPRPGGTQPERKVSYFLAAQGTPYVAGAGVYDATAKVEDLDKLSGE